MHKDVTNSASANYTDLPIEVSPERATNWEDLALGEGAIERLRLAGTHDDNTVGLLEAYSYDLAGRIEGGETAEALQGFVLDAVDHNEALDRLATIHTIEQLEGRRRRSGQRESLVPIPWPGWINPKDPHRRKRVLRDLEFGLVRLVALDRLRQHVLAIAMGESGASAGELPLAVPSMFDIRTNTVLLPGGVDGLDTRTSAVPTWAVPTVHQVVTALGDADICMLYTGRSADPAKVQSCIAMNAGNILRTAGIGHDPSVSFGSLRHSTARKILDSAGTDAAVAFLGESNYETVRTNLGLYPAAPIRPRK